MFSAMYCKGVDDFWLQALKDFMIPQQCAYIMQYNTKNH